MTTSLNNAVSSLEKYCQQSGSIAPLTFHRGVEREGLRVNKNTGRISHQPHPKELGSTLTHSSVTTDYSEALLEFITKVHPSVEGVLQELANIHLYVNHVLANNNECLWPASMPGYIDGNDDVPIAEYGTSNTGKLKHIYRQGLSHRYGRVMQCIAGMHYNFSFDDEFWHFLRQFKAIPANEKSDQDFRSDSYFALIRNFRRSSWLLPLLFGASPAIDSSFLNGKSSDLSSLSEDSLTKENAVSLRMSDLGYSNDAQASLYVCYNEVDTYIQTIRNALTTPFPPYEEIGVKVNSEYRQLNSNILQIENEYYSDVRPKRVTRPSEHPSAALRDRGVEYIEIRIMDLDPFSAVGMNEETLYFIDVYLLYCMLAGDNKLSSDDCAKLKKLQQDVVKNGRNLNANFDFLSGKKTIKAKADKFLNDILSVAQMLTNVTGNKHYVDSVNAQIDKLNSVNGLPSAKVMALTEEKGSYAKAMLEIANQQQSDWLTQNVPEDIKQKFTKEAEESIAAQLEIERNDQVPFDEFLQAYQQPQ
ncbi:glutamate--cysteine ligase [Marinomonas agarivorans]|nr:glutamate--cysteine ligase [Marinomonas agarivorans]